MRLLRSIPLSLLAVLLSAAPAHAAQAAEGGASGLLTPSGGLMFWTLVIFVVLAAVTWSYRDVYHRHNDKTADASSHQDAHH